MKNINSRGGLALLSIVVTLLVLALYVSVMSVRLTGANFGNDSGDFLSAILTRGIPHPSGYPTYMLLGILVNLLPFGSVYTRVESLSFIPASIASGLLCFWVGRLVAAVGKKGAWLAGLTSGLAWGLSPLLWSQAVIIEVHGLQSLLTVLALWWVTQLFEFSKPTQSKIIFYLLAFMFGLGMGNHLTLVLFAPVCLAGLWAARRAGMGHAQWAGQIASFCLGVCVYLYLPFRAQFFPAINWGNPQTWHGFFWLVSGQAYQGLLFDLPWMTVASRLIAWLNLMRVQFGAFGLLFVMIGAVNYAFRTSALRWVLVWIVWTYSLFAIFYGTEDSSAYLIPVVMVMAIWAGLSVVVIEDLLEKYPWRWAAMVLVAVAVLMLIPSSRQRVDPRGDTRPADFAEQVLKELPANAIILTSSDRDSFPLWYYHFGLGARDDIAIVVLPLTQYVWYQETIAHIYPGLNLPPISRADTRTQQWGEQIILLNPTRPVCRSVNDGKAAAHGSVLCNNP